MKCSAPRFSALLVAALFALPNCRAWALEDIPIVAASELGLPLSVPAYGDFDRAFGAPLPARLNEAAGGELIVLNTCRDYLAVRDRITGSDTDANFRVLRLQTIPCLALALLKLAAVATRSALPQDFRQQLGTSDYPASLWPAVSDDEREQQSLPDATLATVSALASWQVADGETLELEDSGVSLHLTLLARGDFDHDDWEDAAFSWEAHAVQGSYSDARLVVLTRNGAETRFREMNWSALLGAH
jgi:hypothetical protein